mmetsp:Transcript_27485/g.27705  ORF Transcript_27485/g.27705 Transcript_27485/m.27705 type:complete len:132 (+) Transcript_27485:221-616(+)
MVVFMIIGRSDPLYEIDLGSSSKDELAYLHQFIMHSSLDLIENAMWINSATFLRVVDRFNNLMVSAYVTPGGAYLLLLHEGRNEDAVKGFFVECHEVYVKYMLNPFAAPDSPICSPQFESHIRSISRKYLS